MTEVRVDGKIQSNKPLGHHRQSQGDAPQVKSGLRKNRLARQEGLGHAFGKADGPCVMRVGSIGKRYEKSRVGDALHDLEKPFLVERFLGPRTDPASRMNERASPLVLALSSCSRTIFP